MNLDIYGLLAVIAVAYAIYGIVGHVCSLLAAKSYHGALTRMHEFSNTNHVEFVYEGTLVDSTTMTTVCCSNDIALSTEGASVDISEYSVHLRYERLVRALQRPVIVNPDTGRYEHSIFSPSRDYHPLHQPDVIRVKIRGERQ